jgi:HEAT repeat protein
MKFSIEQTKRCCLKLLKSEDARVREDAIFTLYEIGTDSFADLVDAIGDVDHKVRAIAIKAIGRTGQGQFAQLLLSALKDPHWLVRSNAIWALRDLNFAGGRESILEFLETEQHGYVRYALDKAFGDPQKGG